MSTLSTVITYLSNQGLHDPCVTTQSASGTRITCTEPLEALHPGGVLVQWRSTGSPGLTLSEQPGTSGTVGGHPSRSQTTPADAGCAALGGDTSMTTAVQSEAMDSHDQLVTMSACLRAPGVAQARADLERMLDSVRLASG